MNEEHIYEEYTPDYNDQDGDLRNDDYCDALEDSCTDWDYE